MASDKPVYFEDYKVFAWLETLPSTAIEADRPRTPLRKTAMTSLPPSKRMRRDSELSAQEREPQQISPRKDAPTEMDETGYSEVLQRTETPVLRPKGVKTLSSVPSGSSSPAKTIRSLRMADPPIMFFEAACGTVQPPKVVSQFYDKVLDVSDSIKMYPESLKGSIVTYCENFNYRIPSDEYFKKSADPTSQPTQQEVYTWEVVKRIQENAVRCSQDGDSEAGWGEMVYSQILDVAIRNSPHKHCVGWKNVSASRIEPKSLGPKHLSGKLFASKMVDYSMTLLPDDAMSEAILEVLRYLPEEDQNINQTSDPVRFSPITVNIEVKVPGEGKNKTTVQLAVWAAAQMRKLNMLSGKLALIGIPLVSVEGHTWRLYSIYQEQVGTKVEQRIWGNNIFGDSSSILGLYRIIAVIEVLAEWSHTVYKAWFEKDILKLPEKGVLELPEKT